MIYYIYLMYGRAFIKDDNDQKIRNGNYFFLLSLISVGVSLKAVLKCLIASTIFFDNSGIFFEPNKISNIIAMITNSFIPIFPNIFFIIN